MSHHNSESNSARLAAATEFLNEFSTPDLLDSVDVGLFAVDLEGNLIYGNRAATDKLALARGEQWSGPAAQLADWFELLGADNEVLPFSEWPVARALRGEQVKDEDHKIRRNDRTWSSYHRYSSKLLHDRHGEPRLILMTMKDISDRGELQEQLRLRVEELETVMDLAPVALFVSDDPHCENIMGNRLANTLYAAEPGENLSAKGSKDRRFFADGRELATDELPMQMAAARNVTVRNHELEVLVHGERRFDILCSATPLYAGDGTVRGCVAGFLDITERKRAEAELAAALTLAEQQRREAESSHRELESFSYSVSHDLQAPLRAINGFADALTEDCEALLDEQCAMYLQRIQQGSRRMSMLMDGLLRLSNLSRTELTHEQVDLTALAREVVDELRELAPERIVAADIEEGLGTTGDRATLRLLLQNLIGNAWKFTAKQPHGRICLGCNKRNGKDVFFIQDNGAGFDMDNADKLFKPFARLHTDEAFEGTGIGLATVQRIVRRHGGEVWAEGSPGDGASFFFTLPPQTADGRSQVA